MKKRTTTNVKWLSLLMVATLVLAAFLSSLAYAAQAPEPISDTVDGAALDFDEMSQTVPFRLLGEGLGARVDWSGITSSVALRTTPPGLERRPVSDPTLVLPRRPARVERTGFLGQNLKSLKGSDGIIVSLTEHVEPDFTSRFGDKVEAYRMIYLSDKLEVVGFLLRPIDDRVKYPVIIYNRGGNREYGKIESLMYLGFLASQGYVVIASQYRGNDGGQGNEEFGGRDVNDVLNLIPLAESLPFVIPDKIAMLGFSRGGMMTYIAISKTDRIRAAAVVGGPTDLFQLFRERELEMQQVLIDLIGGTPEEKRAAYRKRSAYFWPEKINTPVLILHGGADLSVHVSHATKLAARLDEIGKPHKLVVIPGGHHGLSGVNVVAARNREILNWFEEHLE